MLSDRRGGRLLDHVRVVLEGASMEGPHIHPGAGDVTSGSAPLMLTLKHERDAVARARRFVRECLESSGLHDLVDDARLIVSELVTNALLHAGLPAELVVSLAPPMARLEVRDRSPVPPTRPERNDEAMTGRGLHLIEGLAYDWGVEQLPPGKVVWAQLVAGPRRGTSKRDEDELLARWMSEEPWPDTLEGTAKLFTVHLGEVPTDLLLAAKAHVDNLVREFTLAAAGARTGATGAVPAPIAELIEKVVGSFANARQDIKRQALGAARAGLDHVSLELTLPLSAATAGEEYLRALDEADAYCRAARLLTLESPAQQRVFRRWYVEELIAQLQQAATGADPVPVQSFEQRLLREIDSIATAERVSERSARLHSLADALASALTPEAVANAVLNEGVAALGASGGGLLLAADSPTLAVPGTVGYGEAVVTRLRESRDSELPAAVALRTGQPVWLGSRQERDLRFPELTRLEPSTISMCAVPLELAGRRLGALRFSFAEARLFDDDERSFVLTMAAQCAQALDRAQLYHQRVDAARRLQRSLLPPRLPAIPGAQVSAAYHPIADDLDVWGDFYDVWACGPDRWALAIGDVSGTGPEAAALTALVRHTLRALTMTDLSIATVVERLNHALVDAATVTHHERFCTVALGLLTVKPGEERLELASGGHPGPIIFRSDGSADEIALSGSLLGVFDAPTVETRAVPLGPGDEVVLFTDGVIEARQGTSFFGIGGVLSAAAAARASGASTAEAIERAVLLHARSVLRDDFAVLAVRLGDDQS